MPTSRKRIFSALTDSQKRYLEDRLNTTSVEEMLKAKHVGKVSAAKLLGFVDLDSFENHLNFGGKWPTYTISNCELILHASYGHASGRLKLYGSPWIQLDVSRYVSIDAIHGLIRHYLSHSDLSLNEVIEDIRDCEYRLLSAVSKNDPVINQRIVYLIESLQEKVSNV